MEGAGRFALALHVMLGLGPSIHVFLFPSSPKKLVDGRPSPTMTEKKFADFQHCPQVFNNLKRLACLAWESRAESFASLRTQLWVHTEKGPERHRTGKGGQG